MLSLSRAPCTQENAGDQYCSSTWDEQRHLFLVRTPNAVGSERCCCTGTGLCSHPCGNCGWPAILGCSVAETIYTS